MPIANVESHSLLPDLVRRGGVVFDCGANVGAFSRAMVERFGCRVFAFEASPATFAQLPALPGLTVRNIAVCGAEGPVHIALDADITRTRIDAESRNGDTTDVQGHSLARLVAEAGIEGPIEVLKLDIEGAELAAIDAMPDDLILRIGQITVEFHDFLDYYPTAEVERRVARIASLGFRELCWSRERNTGDVLLVHPDRLGALRYACEHHIVRPVRALGRAFRRCMPHPQ